MGEAARALLDIVLATSRMATEVWPDGPEAEGESWRAGWRRKFGDGIPAPILTAERDGVTVRLFSGGRMVLERGELAKIHQLRTEGAAPTSLELSAGRFREELAGRLAEFWGVPLPSRRER